jgi:threonine aldolase
VRLVQSFELAMIRCGELMNDTGAQRASQSGLFRSDNSATVAPEIMAALAAANVPCSDAYDGDPWSKRLDAVFADFFGHECRVFAASTGTAANALALTALCPPFASVLCHHLAHINTDECGAPEFFTGGAKLLLCDGEDAKLTPASAAAALATLRGDVHQCPVRALSISQASELGTVYSIDEVAALGQVARERGLRFHMDGARFANALVSLGCHPADITWRAGIDVLSFGVVKNGGLSAEAVVFFDLNLAEDFGFRRKRAGQLQSKGRFQAAQLLAYIESGVWQRNAQRANDAAQIVARAAGARLAHPVQANMVFARLGAAAQRLRDQGYHFYTLPGGQSRLVLSWDTPTAQVEALAGELRELAQGN